MREASAGLRINGCTDWLRSRLHRLEQRSGRVRRSPQWARPGNAIRGQELTCPRPPRGRCLGFQRHPPGLRNTYARIRHSISDPLCAGQGSARRQVVVVLNTGANLTAKKVFQRSRCGENAGKMARSKSSGQITGSARDGIASRRRQGGKRSAPEASMRQSRAGPPPHKKSRTRPMPP